MFDVISVRRFVANRLSYRASERRERSSRWSACLFLLARKRRQKKREGDKSYCFNKVWQHRHENETPASDDDQSKKKTMSIDSNKQSFSSDLLFISQIFFSSEQNKEEALSLCSSSPLFFHHLHSYFTHWENVVSLSLPPSLALFTVGIPL